ncbi:AzlC family ABC transporter permease [uncultured Ilumatobacter sp.]|uniref:AzlC family ABC transporter permease n=1 Tax=uncultured Ilumatobacter sp. TaxID=879968 RepID=UPI00374EFE7C
MGESTGDLQQAAARRAIRRQAASIVAAVAPFGIVFGASAARAGLTFLEAIGFSALIFGGSSQFAAAEILGDGGSIASAAIAGLLLNVRSLAFGVIMAPALTGVLWQRAAMSQLMIDESTAVGTSTTDLALRRYGYLCAGIGVFVVWNITTVLGHLVVSDAGDLINDFGLDAAGPAAFLALLWPRLQQRPQLRTALAGAAIALVLVPIAPPGVPILAAITAVLAAGRQTAAVIDGPGDE